MYSITMKELLEVLKANVCSYGDLKVFAGCSYGDRLETFQAVSMTGIDSSYIEETGYSSTGYKIIDDGLSEGLDEDRDENEMVAVLNFEVNNHIESAMTVNELIADIESNIGNIGEDTKVVFGTNYGDRAGTMQANGICGYSCSTAKLVKTCYSDSGYKMVSCDNESAELKTVFSLSEIPSG